MREGEAADGVEIEESDEGEGTALMEGAVEDLERAHEALAAVEQKVPMPAPVLPGRLLC